MWQYSRARACPTLQCFFHTDLDQLELDAGSRCRWQVDSFAKVGGAGPALNFLPKQVGAHKHVRSTTSEDQGSTLPMRASRGRAKRRPSDPHELFGRKPQEGSRARSIKQTTMVRPGCGHDLYTRSGMRGHRSSFRSQLICLK